MSCIIRKDIEICHTFKPSVKNGIRQQSKRQIPVAASQIVASFVFSILVTIQADKKKG